MGRNYLEVERANKVFFVRIKSWVTLSDRVLVFGTALYCKPGKGFLERKLLVLGRWGKPPMDYICNPPLRSEARINPVVRGWRGGPNST